VRLNDEVIGIGQVVVDITDRQQAEDFRAVVMQNMAEGLVVTDGEGRVMFMNAAASRMTGWSEDELRGKAMHAAIHYQHADGSSFPAEESPLMKIPCDGRTVRIAEDAFTGSGGSATLSISTSWSCTPSRSSRSQPAPNPAKSS
jgi:two-component system NtrC family sensor kinase